MLSTSKVWNRECRGQRMWLVCGSDKDESEAMTYSVMIYLDH